MLTTLFSLSYVTADFYRFSHRGRATFVRIQRVIWDYLLAFKGKIIQKEALFSFSCRN